MAASGRYPTFSKVADGLAETSDYLDLDDIFEFGLPPHLDGIAALIERQSGGESAV